MPKIDLQNKTKAMPGTVEAYWFNDLDAEGQRTLFHRITIPLQAFDSGLESDTRPVSTEIVFDWYELDLDDQYELDGLDLAHDNYDEAEAFVLIGGIDNWCDVKHLRFEKAGKEKFKVSGELMVEFENEKLGKNEPFNFETTVSVCRR
jgi:hypothetical protein